MGDTTLTSPDMEWLQLYEQSFHQEQGTLNSCSVLSDSSLVATSNHGHNNIGSPSNSSTTTSPPSSGVVVSPGGNCTGRSCTSSGFSKPIRRRSRASKKTPTTHLNASANNFRALVQKFTGCPKKRSPGSGPINLNFKLGRVQSRRGSRNSLVSLFGGSLGHNHIDHNNSFHQDYHQNIASHHVGWPEPEQSLQGYNSNPFDAHDKVIINNVGDDNHNNLPVSSGGGHDHPSITNSITLSNSHLEMPDAGFSLLDDFPLHEFPLLEESFSSEVVNDCIA